MHRRLIYCFLVIIFGVTSCGYNPYFDENVSIKDEAWSQSDTVELTVDIEDTEEKFDMFINVRNNKTYAYMNLFMFIDIIDPDGEMWRDTLAFQLADEKGNWRSDDVSETYVMTSFSAYTNYSFPKKGTYTFKLIHGMYDEPLKGISDIGVKLKLHE